MKDDRRPLPTRITHTLFFLRSARMSIRWKFFITLLIFSLLPLVLVTSISQKGTRRLGWLVSEGASGNMTRLLKDQLIQTAEDYSALIDSDKRAMEYAVLSVARLVEQSLQDPAPDQAVVRFARDFQTAETAPADLAPDPEYERHDPNGTTPVLVSWESQVFLACPYAKGDSASNRYSTAPAGLKDKAARLTRLLPALKELIEVHDNEIYRLYAGFKDGLHSSYPGHSAFPPGYDSRLRPWYERALAKPDEPVWTSPVVDASTGKLTFTVSKAVLDENGRPMGAVGLDLLISKAMQDDQKIRSAWSEMVHTIMFQKLDPPEQDESPLYVIAHKPPMYGESPWLGMTEKTRLESTDPVRFKQFLDLLEQAKSGVMSLPYEGVSSFWAFAAFEGDNYFLLVVPESLVAEAASQAREAVLTRSRDQLKNTAMAAGITVALVFLVALVGSRSAARPLLKLAQAAKNLGQGDFSTRVDIVTGDERDQVIEAINDIGPKLEDRLRLLKALELAQEVQQNLLPRVTPDAPGFDIAGASIYCDETGGDYYDFFKRSGANGDSYMVIVGDVSGHGAPSALLMATARALLRGLSEVKDNLAERITLVNRLLCADVHGTGRFMTMFCLEIDADKGVLHWVRAGHDPALVYNPADDSFSELLKDGVVLGVRSEYVYEQHLCPPLSSGMIIVLGTDGIWEQRDQQEEMFGRERLCAIIRQNADKSARQIRDAVFAALEEHRGAVDQSDDVTLAVIKKL